MSAAQLFNAVPIPSPHFNLPQELVDIVIDHLEDDDDQESLRTVGLVCRSWYPRSRDHLFYIVEMETESGGSISEALAQAKQLAQLLEANPPLGRCVKAVVIGPLSPEWFEGDSGFEEELTSVLPILTRLEYFTFLAESPFCWNSLSEEVRDVIYTVISRPSLHHLCLEGFSDIELHHFLRGSNIKQLEIRDSVSCASSIPHSDGTSLTSPTNASDAVTTPSTTEEQTLHTYTLASLKIQHCGQMLTNFFGRKLEGGTSPNRLRARELTVEPILWDDSMGQAFARLLQHSADFVEIYAVEQDEFVGRDELNTPITPSVFEFDRLPNLKSLTIVALGKELAPDSKLNPLPAVLRELGRISQNPVGSKLEAFKLELDFSPHSAMPYPAERILDTIFGMRDILSSLDKILSQPAFARLRVVTISFDVALYDILGDRVDSSMATEIVSDSGWLKELAGRGILNIEST